MLFSIILILRSFKSAPELCSEADDRLNCEIEPIGTNIETERLRKKFEIEI